MLWNFSGNTNCQRKKARWILLWGFLFTCSYQRWHYYNTKILLQLLLQVTNWNFGDTSVPDANMNIIMRYISHSCFYFLSHMQLQLYIYCRLIQHKPKLVQCSYILLFYTYVTKILFCNILSCGSNKHCINKYVDDKYIKQWLMQYALWCFRY